MNRSYQKIILYEKRDKYDKLKEKLAGVPVSVWFRARVADALKKKEIKI